MSKAYYNEIDPKVAAWLRELIKCGLIADGDVDERSIADVTAGDIAGYAQCHFFAGIGGWSYALRLAGIPDNFPIWTASLPCQPFSVAGKQLGKADERHLLPHYIELVKQCRPTTQFGEQVASAIKHGWACDLQAAMEAEGYAIGYHVLGSHSVGSFHQRQRLYWVAHSNSLGCDSREANSDSKSRASAWSDCRSANNELADNSSTRLEERQKQFARKEQQAIERSGDACVFGNAKSDDKQRNREREARSGWKSEIGRSSLWSNPDWIECRDNKSRPIKPGLAPLAYGIPARVVRLRGYGNAIVPQVAAEFIAAFCEVVSC
jgi:DNA (cytosine-5)-methyltransferase 1